VVAAANVASNTIWASNGKKRKWLKENMAAGS